MFEFLGAILLLLVGGMAAVACCSRAALCQTAGQSGAVAGSMLGLVAAVRILVSGQPEAMTATWLMPGGGFHLQIDALAAFSLLPQKRVAFARKNDNVGSGPMPMGSRIGADGIFLDVGRDCISRKMEQDAARSLAAGAVFQ